jgi:hypothetical protein
MNQGLLKCTCGGTFNFHQYCGAYVCAACGKHRGLCRCYCGWSESGGNGYRELEDEGETIEPEDA